MNVDNLTAVVFDLDNTLFNRQRAFARWAAVSARRWRPDWTTAERRCFVCRALEDDDWGGADRLRVAEAMSRRLSAAGCTAAELWNDLRCNIAQHVRVDGRVIDLLDALHRVGLRLALASNGSRSNQLAKMRACVKSYGVAFTTATSLSTTIKGASGCRVRRSVIRATAHRCRRFARRSWPKPHGTQWTC